MCIYHYYEFCFPSIFYAYIYKTKRCKVRCADQTNALQGMLIKQMHCKVC